jgi:hypothetical protein
MPIKQDNRINSRWIQPDFFLNTSACHDTSTVCSSTCDDESREGKNIFSTVFSVACLCIAAAELTITLILLTAR